MSQTQDDRFYNEEEIFEHGEGVAMTPRKLRRSTTKEELYVLTGDDRDAKLLNELIRCQAKSRDRDAYIEEERNRLALRGEILNLPQMRGWFYKTAKELAIEAQIKLADSNIRLRLKRFVERGWLQERHNPTDPRDRTMQYRVPIVALDEQLQEIGYFLDGWLISRIKPSPDSPFSILENAKINSNFATSNLDSPISKSEVPFSESELSYKASKQQQQVINKQVTTTNKQSAGALERVVVEDFSNLNPANAGTDSRPSTPVTGETEETEVDAILDSLVAIGVTASAAMRLIGNYGVTVCTEQLAALPDRNPKDPAATLVSSIQNEWAIPIATKARLDAAKREREHRRHLELETAKKADARRLEAQEQERRAIENVSLDEQWANLSDSEQAAYEPILKSKLGVVYGRPDSPARIQLIRDLMRERTTKQDESVRVGEA